MTATTVRALPGMPGPGRPLYPHARPEVRAALDTGALLLEVGRDSGDGPVRVQAAARNALGGLRRLALDEQVLIEHLTPSIGTLVEHHRATRTIASFDEYGAERTFEVESSLWTDPTGQLGVLLICGSGTKIDAEELHQPAIKIIAEYVRRLDPAILHAQENARLGRENYQALINVLRVRARAHAQVMPLLGFQEHRLAVMDAEYERFLLGRGVTAREEASAMRSRNDAGKRADCGKELLERPGFWSWTTSYSPPPGMVVGRLKQDTAGRPRQVACWDSPTLRPAPHEVAEGFVQVTRPDGTVADQLETLRWLGKHLGQPRCGLTAIVAELVVRGWTTPGRVRRGGRRESSRALGVHPPSGDDPRTRLSRTNAQKLLRTFLHYLDFYLTGHLTVPLGDGTSVEVDGLVPPDGPVLSPTDHSRIQAWVQDRSGCRGPRRKLMFSGQPIVLGGEPRRWSVDQKRGINYYPAMPKRPYTRVRNARGRALPPVPHEVLAGWYTDALCALAEPWSLHLADSDPAPDAASAELVLLRAEVAELTRRQEARAHDLDPGVGSLDGPARQVVSSAFNADAPKLAKAQQRLRVLECGPVTPAGARGGLPISELAREAARLQQPYDSDGLRQRLREATVSLELSYVRRISVAGRPAYDVHAELTLAVHDGTSRYQATSQHHYVAGAVRRTPERLRKAVDGLYDGVPLRDTLGADYKPWLPAIAACLGCPGSFRFARVDDGRLLRLSMAVLHPRLPDVPWTEAVEELPLIAGPPVAAGQLPRLARKLDEQVALLRAIHAAYAGQQIHRWLHDPAPAVSAWFAHAAAHDGLVSRAALPAGAPRGQWSSVITRHRTADEWQQGAPGVQVLRPCRSCGGTARLLLRLREATGSVCLTCRTDRAGVRWDASYDRYGDRS